MSLHSRYTIVRKIADGGTAEIFLAKQHGAQGFEKVVVLKRIFPSFYADPQFRHMLVDEAHIAMSLNHSNIVQVFDLGEAEGRYFLALELVDGWTLDGVLRRAKIAGIPFPPPLALYVTAEVCRALAYAHGKAREGTPLGIVHRDVSPHNILVSEQGEVKLTDFGIAKAQNKREQTLGSVIKGKIAFMSPEQASGTELDARSDLFSLGTMLYVMITRRYPFDAPTDFETLMQVRSGDFLPPETARPGLNPELYRVIRKAMGKIAGDRYQKAEEMLVDVEQVMRLAFRPVGQTELMRWLAELAEKDGAVPLTRDTSAPLTPNATGESGIVLDIHDAEVVTPVGEGPEVVAPMEGQGRLRPPPLPSANAGGQADAQSTDVVLKPRRRWALVGGGLALAVLGLVGWFAIVKPARKAEPPSQSPRAQNPTQAAAVVDAPAAAASPAAQHGPDVTGQPPTPTEIAAATTDAAPVPIAAAQDKPAAAAQDGAGAVQPAGKPLAKNQVAVTVNSEPDGAKVLMHREEIGTTPLILRLKRGSAYQLTFTKTGYVSASKKGRVANRALNLKATLKKSPPPKKSTASASKTNRHSSKPSGARRGGLFSR
ncbi:MAG TPA: serine/threonine-protein kinase [Polyangia bacterium]|nr:serine/threonine-protein kinase [Polyangia bacterium]